MNSMDEANRQYWNSTRASKPSLLDWKINPLAGIPVWLAVTAQKLSNA